MISLLFSVPNTFGINDSEVKFVGTAIEYFELIGGVGWMVRVDEMVSGPDISGHIVDVYLAPLDPEQYNSNYYIGRWTDVTEGGANNNLPDQGDTFEILLSDPPHTSPKPSNWMTIFGLYLIALIMIGASYASHKGWIKVETQTSPY